MKRIMYALAFACLMTLTFAQAQRGGGGGRGGGGARGGGGGGGFTAPARPAAAPAPSRPAAAPAGNRTSGTGPGGGSFQAGSGSGSHTTQRGGTINYGGAAIGGTGGSGVSGGKYVGGVSVTTAGGQTINKASKGGAVAGPGGNAVGGKTSVGNTYGTYGSGAAASKSGFASGPNGTAAYRGGVAAGPNGAAAYHSGGAVTSQGTYYRSAAAINTQGGYVRAGAVAYHGCFTNAWCGRYPGAWYPTRWGAAAAWTAVTWAALSTSYGYPAEPMSYDYGSSVVYQDDSVYVNGENVGTSEEYVAQAATIADTGKKATVDKEEEFKSLGVFAMVIGEDKTSYNIFQLAINKDGVLRGNYYNALTDTNDPVYGSVDKKTQRAAWTVGDKKAPTYEAGIFNLTEEETTMMVHYSKDRSQQFSLIRIQKPEDQTATPMKDGK